MLTPPDGLDVFDEAYSNFDGVLPDGAEEAVRRGMALEHPAWDHWGLIWFADGQFHEMVKVYTAHAATVSADTLEDLFTEVNNQFGWS